MDNLENLLDVVLEKQDIMEQTYMSLDTLSNECQVIKNMLMNSNGMNFAQNNDYELFLVHLTLNYI